MSDLVSKKEVIAIIEDFDTLDGNTDKMELIGQIERVRLSVDLLRNVIEEGITCTDAEDIYSCGMRNGMRWCMSLIDGKEPAYEDASQYSTRTNEDRNEANR